MVMFIFMILVLVVFASNIRIVQQSRAVVIERLGAFQTVWGVGLHVKMPFITTAVNPLPSGMGI